MFKSIPIFTILLAFVAASHIARAEPRALVGTFIGVGSDVCQQNDAGFSAYPDLFQLAPSIQVFDTWESKTKFHANGQVHDVSTGQYGLPGFFQPVGTYESVCDFTSAANADGSFTLTGECNAKVLSGIAKGEQNNVKPVVWKIMPMENDVILWSGIGTEVRTLTTNQSGIHYRICQCHGIGSRTR